MNTDVGMLNQVTEQFMHAFQHDAVVLQTAAKHLFFYLCLIQLTVSALWLSLAGESLQRLFLRLVQHCLSFSVFYACIEFGGQWIPQVINGFIQLGQQSGLQSINPSAVIDQGIHLSSAILHGFFSWGLLGHPFISMVGAVICIAIVVIYALLAAELAIVIVKSYLLVSLSSLFFAFAGTDVTRVMTVRFFQTVIGIGLHLMSLYFLMGVGQHIGQDWASMTLNAAKHHELMPMFVILAGVIVYYLIVKNVPSFIAGLAGVGGFRNTGEEAVGAALHAGFTGARQLSQGFHLAGAGAQGVGQTARAAYQMGGVANSAFHKAPGGVAKSFYVRCQYTGGESRGERSRECDKR